GNSRLVTVGTGPRPGSGSPGKSGCREQLNHERPARACRSVPPETRGRTAKRRGGGERGSSCIRPPEIDGSCGIAGAAANGSGPGTGRTPPGPGLSPSNVTGGRTSDANLGRCSAAGGGPPGARTGLRVIQMQGTGSGEQVGAGGSRAARWQG